MLHGVTGTGEMIRPLGERLLPDGWGLFHPDGFHEHPKRGFSWWSLDGMDDVSRALGNGSHAYDDLDTSTARLSRMLPDGDLVVCGFSQGGAMAMELLSTSVAGRIRGLALLGTRCLRPMELKSNLQSLEGRMLWMHGEIDHRIPLDEARMIPRLFEESGWSVLRMEHEKGHTIPLELQDGIRDWLHER